MATVLDEAPPPHLTMDNIEELRAYLWKRHGVTIGLDDPIMLLNTLNLLALAQHEKLIEKHNDTLAKEVSSAAAKFGADMQQALERFKNEALSDVVRDRVQSMNHSAELADRTVVQFRKTLRTQKILTAINILSVVCALGVLAALAR